MNAPTCVKSHFVQNTVLVVDNAFLKRLEPYADKLDAMKRVVDFFGTRSSMAQGLSSIITTFEKVRISRSVVYLYFDAGTDQVVGMLKVGFKNLFIQGVLGDYHEIRPLCVLDFYVHESMQRKGIGGRLFDFMLDNRKVGAEDLAYDRPSGKLISFLRKRFGLDSYVPQVNRFVVFNEYFVPKEDRKPRPRPSLDWLHGSGSRREQPDRGPRAAAVQRDDGEAEAVGEEIRYHVVDGSPARPASKRVPIGFDTAALQQEMRDTVLTTSMALVKTPEAVRTVARNHSLGVRDSLKDIVDDDDEDFRYKTVSQSPLRKKELNPYGHSKKSRYSRYY